MNVSALIIGIDGWEQYTLPLIQSIQKYQFDCEIVVIDNASKTTYPESPMIHRTERMGYSKAINYAHSKANQNADWYIVLSNDVVCTGPFKEYLTLQNTLIGPKLMENQGWHYLEGWCVACPNNVWNVLGGWDETFKISSWEDVDFSNSALECGFDLFHHQEFPFVHLDQKQRFNLIPNYWDSEFHNYNYFLRKHSKGD